jgi:hypothetical protein
MKSTVTCSGYFERMLVPDLKSYLVDRGIRKAALVRLCQTAFDLELDVLTTSDDKLWTNCAGLFLWMRNTLL